MNNTKQNSFQFEGVKPSGSFYFICVCVGVHNCSKRALVVCLNMNVVSFDFNVFNVLLLLINDLFSLVL